MTEIGLFDAMYTARALRRLKPDPVPEELITRVLDAAIRAPSGGNAIVAREDAPRSRSLTVSTAGAAHVAYAARGARPHWDQGFHPVLTR